MTLAYLIKSITALLPFSRYVLVFAATIVEGPLVTMGAGLLASWGLINPGIAYVVIVVAEMVSDSIYYGIGMWGGDTVKNKFSALIRMPTARLEKLKTVMVGHPRKVIVVGKLTHVIGVPVLLTAGITRVRFNIFFLFDLLATLPKTLCFLLVGYYFGAATQTVDKYITEATLIASILLVLIFVAYIVTARRIEEKIL